MLTTLLLAFGAACGAQATATPAPEGNGARSSKLKVISTVSPITSIVENIGGTRIALEGIIPEGVNSHTFDPAPSVAQKLAAADLVVLNGLLLEEPTLEMAKANRRVDAVILLLGDRAVSPERWQFDFSFPESAGHPNPHVWPDPFLALDYAALVRDELSQLDPPNAEYYAGNYALFESRIQELDRAIQAAVASIPPANRKLLTYHDSWAYFALRYGMQVIGAVQPSNFSEPSSREVARLIDQVKDEAIPAVFGSEVFPSAVLEQIASEAGARFVDQLADDDLPGAPGDPRHSYLGLMSQNMEVMVEALGGDPSLLDALDTTPVFDGESGAVYPQ